MSFRSTSLCQISSAVLICLAGGCDSGNDQAIEATPTYTPSCSFGLVYDGTNCVPIPEPYDRVVAFNSAGYHPDRAKFATLLVEVDAFSILDASDEVVLRGTPGDAIHDNSLDQDVWVIDFTEIRDPGEYHIDIEGLDPAYAELLTFRIDQNVFDAALQAAMLGITGQRCGTEVQFSYQGATFAHDACHLLDGSLDLTGDAGASGTTDGIGGWHDAGDYGKYVVNGAFALGFMLSAWEQLPGRLARDSLDLQIPEDGDLPLFLAEMKWELDWLFKMQRQQDGAVYHKLTRTAFEGELLPEADSGVRFFAPVGSAATADFVAVMAQAARIFEEYDSDFAADCLAAAAKSYAFLQDNLSPIVPNQLQFDTGLYATDDSDDRAWAAAEMWQTTGNGDALVDFEERAQAGLIRANFDWSNVGNLGIYTYLTSSREGRNEEKLASLTTALMSVADSLVQNSQRSPFGLGYGGNPYWGINGAVLGSASVAIIANKLNPKPEYLDAAVQQLDYAFGRNVLARSFVTGVGIAPPQNPHHRPSLSDSVRAPWPGLLVGGPNLESGGATWADYNDLYGTYWNNEVALNWSAALIFALSADFSD